MTIEPPHDKTNKMSMRPSKTQISLGIRPVWSVFAVRMQKAWVLNYPLSEVDAQADLSCRWAHTHFVGFVMRRLTTKLVTAEYRNDPKFSDRQV